MKSELSKISRISPLTNDDSDDCNDNADTNDDYIVVWTNVDRSVVLSPGVFITERSVHPKILQWYE